MWRHIANVAPIALDGTVVTTRLVAPTFRAGVSEGEIMKLCGWKTRAMFDRYNIIDEQDLARAVTKRFPVKAEPAKESPEPNGIVTA